MIVIWLLFACTVILILSDDPQRAAMAFLISFAASPFIVSADAKNQK